MTAKKEQLRASWRRPHCWLQHPWWCSHRGPRWARLSEDESCVVLMTLLFDYFWLTVNLKVQTKHMCNTTRTLKQSTRDCSRTAWLSVKTGNRGNGYPKSKRSSAPIQTSCRYFHAYKILGVKSLRWLPGNLRDFNQARHVFLHSAVSSFFQSLC